MVALPYPTCPTRAAPAAHPRLMRRALIALALLAGAPLSVASAMAPAGFPVSDFEGAL